MKLFLVTLLLVSCWALASATVLQWDADDLTFTTKTEALIEGSFMPALSTAPMARIHFVTQPSALTITAVGDDDAATTLPSLSVLDYGSFTRIDLALPTPSTFLVASAPLPSNVPTYIEFSAADDNSAFSALIHALPAVDPSTKHGVDDNLDVFLAIAAKFNAFGISQQVVDQHFISEMIPFVQSPVAASLIRLSIALARAGIDSLSYPSALPLHMTALRTSTHRPDVSVDVQLVQAINRARLNNTIVSSGETSTDVTNLGCSIGNVCGNTCYGMCGKGCSCWSWVCGDCGCHLGCMQHDCCCSCKGMMSGCCLNVAAVRCAGYNNNCQP
eukprot:TRINITY_DN3860_c0_g1_i1.p1 TRINITY_DN3860_c0_g1~~TRINITY_DN3860_c0_g1_i1.p1  ORF type:complete len:330 (+),score=32.39 TRINITY_DN3860_c0_g1_i1:103-1092(+)